MANLFGDSEETQDFSNVSENINTEENISDGVQVAPANTDGLSHEELNDANKIKVTISDETVPIVVLFGPPSCGKTMILTRLARFLHEKEGCRVQPVSDFRPTYDVNYKDMCDTFDDRVYGEAAAESTSKINFMLLKVYKGSKAVCQLLEGPGEYYFSPEDPKAAFPKFVNKIANCNNRKIWAIITEPDKTNPRMGDGKRTSYVLKINDKLVPKMGRHDGTIFIYNKVDASNYVIRPGEVDVPEARREVSNLYPGIFNKFVNTNPITKFFKPYNFDFVPFHTGDYSETNDGSYTFEQGHDVYPRLLWKAILNQING